MSPRMRKMFAKFHVPGKKDFFWLKHTLALVWIEVRFDIEEWVLLKTWKFRARHSKELQLSSLAYYNEGKMAWEDVEVADQWGLWLPIGFGIVSKANWDFDQQINRDIGEPEQPWEDFIDGDWPTYYYKDEFLNSNHYFDAARKHFKKKLGDDAYAKEISLTLKVVPQKWIDDETKRWMDWVADGSPKMKIEFAESGKDSFREILGADAAEQLFKETEERNKQIDNTKQSEGLDDTQK